MSRELARRVAPMGTPSMTSAEILRGAADQLASGGPGKWVKGAFHDDGGGSCALGAIEHAMVGKCMIQNNYEAAEIALLQTLKAMHPELQANTIPDLNDDPTVTYEDILAAFEKTALQFEEKA